MYTHFKSYLFIIRIISFATLLVTVLPIPVHACLSYWLCTFWDLGYSSTNSHIVRSPDDCEKCLVWNVLFCSKPLNRERFGDEELRQHAVTCDGFYFMDHVNRGGLMIPTNRVRCESCKELERRVRNGPAVEDLPIAEFIRDPNLKRYVPDSNLLAIMPTGSSSKEYVEEYQKVKHKYINRKNNDEEMMVYYN